MIKIKVIENTFSKINYNQKAAHPLQSWEWGEARSQLGLEVVRIGVFIKDLLSDVYQMTIHKVPHTPFHIGYIPRSRLPSKQVLDFIKSLSSQKNIIFVKFEPNIESDKTNRQSIMPALQESPHPLFPKWTQLLDLEKGEDLLIQMMKPKTRYNVRLAQKKGVVVKEVSNETGFKTFIDLYFDTCKRQRYFGHDLLYHETIWNKLKGKIAHILIAYYDNRPLAAYEVFLFNEIIYYTYGGTSELHRNLMASNLLMWELIRFGRNNKAKKLDMWGSLPPVYKETHPWAGFTRFKEGYGGTFIEMVGAYDLVINQPLYLIYNRLNTLRSIYLSLISP